MTILRLIGAAVLLTAGTVAYADPCKVSIESNDMMQFNTRELAVPADCGEVEVTLHHAGKLASAVMGHDWVLAKESDMSGVVNAGLAAGAARGYLPQGDARIIAATKVIGGGESATVRFPTTALTPGARYAFFCTSPGHSSVMRGKFLFGAPTRVAQADKKASGG
ncbi:MAG TPA: azurin [Steroidobacteraceae bacterium]|nr:azurin [Steroidobacteraceae bacterium]